MTPEFSQAVEIDWLKRWAMYSPQRPALKNGDTGMVLTYKDLHRQSLNLANTLKERFNISRGDRVACLAQNELEYISLFFATQRLGAILVPVNVRFTAAEAAHVVRDSGAQLLIAQKDFWSALAEIEDKVTIWNFDGPESLMEAAVTPRGGEIPFAGVFEDPCMILYTSGTTGAPKGAVLSNRMIFWNSINTSLRLNLSQSDVTVSFAPLFHTGGWNVLLLPCLHRGAEIVMLKKFDADQILRLCESEKVNVFFGVPTTMDFMRRSPLFEKVDLSSVRYAIVGGEPMPLEAIRAWQKRGIPVRQGYGLTEFGPNVFSLNEEDSERKMGSIGSPNFYIEARVAGEGEEDLGHDQVGELILRGPVAMSGYWQNPRATAETLSKGWLRTGDLVKRDSEGYYYVVGRKKEMFISGGENVYPAEVEKVLRQWPNVREAAVIGVPHEKWGESGKAFVVFDKQADADTESLREHCLKHLAKFKIPQEFVVLPELPKTDSGKIAKKLLH